MTAYSNADNTLRQEFEIEMAAEVSESTAGGRADLGRQHGQRELFRKQDVDLGGVAEVDTPLQARGTDLKDREEETCFISSL